MHRKRKISCFILFAFVCLFALVLVAKSRGIRWWEFAYYETPVWSPDGERILYLFAERASEYPTLKIIDSSGWPLLSQGQNIEIPDLYAELPAWRSTSEISISSTNITSLGVTPTYGEATLYLYDIFAEKWESFEAPLSIISGIAWHQNGSYALVSLNNFSNQRDEALLPGIYTFTPAIGKFELWLEAEMPKSIAWSPDGNYVAYFDLISIGNESPVHLNIVEVASKEHVAFQRLSGKNKSLEWWVSSTSLSWSKTGDRLVVRGTLIEYRSPRDYDVHQGLYYFQFDDLTQFTFRELPSNVSWFAHSPSGEEIVITSITRPFFGTNTIHLLNLPEK